jgi:uncharacterized membrane protein YsdA (DUF1294 family)
VTWKAAQSGAKMQETILWIYLAAVNVIALIMCVYDKRAAIKKQRRISEKALFTISIVGGAAGMLAGMLLVRHKTKHWQFMVFVPLLIVVHVVIIVGWLL